jgi:hypothetical protein
MNNPLQHLANLAAQLPTTLVSDWRNTNHYELTAPDHDQYWWWDLSNYNNSHDIDLQSTEYGKRMGLLMDLAAEIARLKTAGLLPPPNSDSTDNPELRS